MKAKKRRKEKKRKKDKKKRTKAKKRRKGQKVTVNAAVNAEKVKKFLLLCELLLSTYCKKLLLYNFVLQKKYG